MEQINLPTKLQLKDLVLNTETLEVFRQGTLINLCNKEFQLLELLMRNSNKVLNRNLLSEKIWPKNLNAKNTLNVHIASLRKKIDKNFEPKLIKTVHHIGYRIKADP